MAIQDHLTAELRHETMNTETLKDPNTFGTKGLRAVIDDHQKRLDSLHEQWILCLRARAAGWQLLSAYPGEQNLKTARQRAVLASMNTLVDDNGLLAIADQQMHQKIDTLKSMFQWQSTIDTSKAGLKAWSKNRLPVVRDDIAKVSQQLVQGQAMLLEQQLPVVLALKFEAGEVVEAYQL